MLNSLSKTADFIKNDNIVDKDIRNEKSEKLKVKTWFCDKDLSSVDSTN